MSKRNYWDNLFLGKKVEFAAAAIAGITTKSIFTVTSGRVCVTALHGEVTVNLEAIPNAMTIDVDPTVGAAGALGTSIETNGAQVGTTFSITGNPGDAAIKNTGVAIGCVQGCVVPAGVITYATAADATGSMKWTLWYYPIDDNAYASAYA